jgi:hypothetical protein
MSEREVAFGQFLTTLEPMGELATELAQCIFNAGWDAKEVQS